jgi:hypothetical protein
MNIRLRSAQSRRDAVRRGLIGYLAAGIESNDLRNDLADDGSSPASTGERLPAAAEAVTDTAPLAHPPTT